MRYTFGFLWVCALSALLLVGCGSEALCEGVVCEDDGNECTNDVCNPATGTCRHVTVEDDTPCDFDALPGLCQAGVCVDAMLCQDVACEDDGNECTANACNPSDGLCEDTPVQDGTACAEARGGCYGGVCNFVPVSVVVGDKELVFDWTTDRCEDFDVPDAPADFARDENGGLVLFDGNAPTYYVSRGADFDSLMRVCDPPALVSADLRTPESYENWEWLWAIYREGSSWHALIHNEFHDAGAPTCKPGDPSPANLCWYNSITYAVSTDGGSTFTKPSPPAHVVAPAPKPWVPPTTPVQGDYLTSGYFLPSSVVRGPEDYYYTVIGAKPEQAQGGLERGLCAMRTKTLGDPTSWRAWDGSGFNLALESPYEIGAVAQACAFLSTPEEVYPVVGSVDLTYNGYLERYMLVTQWAEASNQAGVRCGFYFSLSTDLIHWSQMQEIAAARIVSPACPPDQMAPGQLEPVLIHYPSVVDHEDTTVNFERSGRTPYLYYTRFNDDTLNSLDRDIVRVPLKLTLGGPLCEGVDCDDQNACTEDICNGADGSCEHTPIECPADSNDCTAATCNPITGCEHTSAEDGSPCGGENQFGNSRGGCYAGICNFVPVSVAVGPKEVVFNWSVERCEEFDIPDGPTRVGRAENGELVLLASHETGNYLSRGPDFDSLERDCENPALRSADLLTPQSYENNEWLWSTYREGSSWHALIHNEFHPLEPPPCVGPYSPCWYNSITYAVSTDAATTFVKPGPPAHVVAPAPNMWIPPGPEAPVQDWYAEGYFTPSNIVLGPEDYYYALFVHMDWASERGGACAMRTKTLHDPASWSAWDGTGFNLALTSPYVTGSPSPRCSDVWVRGPAATSSLTYNTHVERYMVVAPSHGAGGCGIYLSLSTDLIHWSNWQLLVKARITYCDENPTTPGLLDPLPILYPSIIDHADSTTNFERPGRAPYLYYTRFNEGHWLDRDLVRVPLTFTLEE